MTGRFKVKREAYFVKGIKTASTLYSTLGATFASTVSITKALTAASTVTLTGSLITGDGGTPIAGILAGSGAAIFGNLNACVASATSLAITGLTTAHKCFISPSVWSACLTPTCMIASPAGWLRIGVRVSSSEGYTGATETFSYLAVLDK